MELLRPLNDAGFAAQNAAYTGTAGSVTGWNAGPQGVLVWCTSDAYIRVGEGVTATTSDTPLPANTPVPFTVPNGTGACVAGERDPDQRGRHALRKADQHPVSSFGIPVRNGLGVGLLASTSLSTRNSSAFSPASLFAAGESGYWLDPSDFSTMFQDSAGGFPVTATGQTCGLILDKRIGTRTQVFDDANVTFSGTAGYAGRISPGVYEYARTVSGNGSVVFGGLVSGRTYLISVQIAAYGGAIPGITSISADFRSALNVAIRTATTAAGTATAFYLADGTTFRIGSTGPTAGATISNVSILEVPGNHFLQATAAKRPLLQQDAQGFYYLQGDGTDDVLNSVVAVHPLGADKSQGFIGVYMDSNAGHRFSDGDKSVTRVGRNKLPVQPRIVGHQDAEWRC